MLTIDKARQSEYSFVLKHFTPADIDSITSDLQMHLDGYQFLYIIDTYDIVENYMPYTDFELFTDRNMANQAQKYICYDYFFGGFNNTESILLEEYKIELLAAKNKLNRHLREAKNVLSNLEKLKSETDQFLNNPQKTEAFFRNNFEVILFLLILNDKTSSILDEFFTFIRNRLHLAEVNLKSMAMSEADSNTLNEIFKSCTHTSFSVELFKQYIDINKMKLLSVDDYEGREIFLENTFRDIKVIERIIRINNELAKTGKKYFAIYLSSAHKTADIFRVLDKSTINKTGFHRSVYQYFLYDRIKKEYKEEGITILQSLKDLIHRVNAAGTTPSDKKDKNVLYAVKTLFDEKSGSIDNHFYWSVYEKYRKTFERMSDQHTKANLTHDEILKIIREVDRNKEMHSRRIFDLSFTLSQLNQAYNMVDTYQGFDDYEPNYHSGSDIISNPYQHLPNLLLIHPKFPGVLRLKLHEFLNCSMEGDKEMLRAKFNELIHELPTLDCADLPSRMLKSLVVTYINLVAQPKSKIAEDALIIDLEKQYEIARISFEKIDARQTTIGNKLETVVTNTDLLLEIAYVLIWLYRRNNREDEAILKCREDLFLKKDDARIHQGLGLCYISTAYKLMKQAADPRAALNLAIEHLQTAYDLFSRLTHQGVTGLLITKNRIAILNSMAYAYVKKFELEKEPDLIVKARQLMEDVKKGFRVLHLDYEAHPIYSAVEFELEYFEALQFFNAEEIGKAHPKIISAISKIGLYKKSQPITDELLLRRQSECNELAASIFKHYIK